MQSYRNQKDSGFFEQNNTVLMVYPIELPDGGYKFANSDLIARYIHASDLLDTDYTMQIVDRLFTESDNNGVNYQAVFLGASREKAEQLLQKWLGDFGASKKEIEQIQRAALGDEVTEIMAQVKTMVESTIHVKGIPTLIYDGKKHNGLYRP
jgi:hypothetical protein